LGIARRVFKSISPAAGAATEPAGELLEPPASAEGAGPENTLAGAPTGLADRIAQRLAAAEANLAALQQRLGAVSLADQLGEPGAGDELIELARQLRAATDAIDQLRAAHQAALAADATADAAALRSRQADQLAALEEHAAGRLEAMTRLAASLEAAHRDFSLFRGLTDRMVNVMGSAAQGGLPEFPVSMVANEMYRLAEHGSVALPGAVPPDYSFRDRPTAIEPAVDIVRRNNGWLIGLLRDRFAMESAA
jgi:hypothetical protein